MKARTFASVAVMTALGVLAPIHAHAFGLGKIELSSSLNEPFKAEIAVSALRGDEEGPLQVQLASNSEFKKAGLERSLMLTQFNFEVIEKDGKTTIQISSLQPVKEPFIDFLLTATTGNGRLIREYTVLLDPPKNVFVKPQVVQQKPKPQQKKTTSVKKKSVPLKSTYKYPDPEMPTATTNNYSTATSYGPVGRSDTLSAIARDTKPSSAISLNQMMMALLKANPRSFQHQNINGLKAGYTLDIPSIDEIQSLSKSQAYAAVKEQHNVWKNRNRVVAAPADSMGQEQMPSVVSEDGKTAIVSNAADDLDDSRLQLVVPHDEASTDMDELAISGDKELVQLSEQLTLAQETIESQAQENVDIKSRMDLMEEQLQTLRRLVTLKDADLARMQSSLDDDVPVVDETIEDNVEMEPTAIDVVEDDLDSESIQTEMTDVESVDTEMGQDELIDEELIDSEELNAEPEMVEVEPIEDEMLEPEVAETESMDVEKVESQQSEVEAYFSGLESGEPLVYDVDEESTDDMAVVSDESVESTDSATKLPLDVAKDFVASYVSKIKSFYNEHKQQSLIAGFVVALLALILLLLRGRRNKEDDVAEDTSATHTAVTVGNTETAPAPENIDTEEQVVETPSSDKTDEDMIMDAYASLEDAEPEVESVQQDVISELEQEELNITEEVNDNLEDLDITRYEVDEPESSTEQVIEEDSSISEVDSTEQQDDSLTLDFNSEELSIDSLADENNDVVEKEHIPAEELLDFNADSDSDVEDTAIEIDDANSEALDFGTSLSLDEDTKGTELDLDDTSLSLDIDSNLLDGINLDDSPVTLELPEEESSDLPTLDIEAADLLPEDSSVSDETLLPIEQSVSDDSDVNFDLGDFDEIDEAETKLDLAGAYMDMGDPEGARSILEEVLIDGDDAQKSRAKSLLNDLS